MTAPAYIYVGDQGRVFASMDEPTDEDLAYAEVGMVTIVRLADYHFYGIGRTWMSIASGKLGQASVEGKLTPPFHVAAAESNSAAPTSGETSEMIEEAISTPLHGGENRVASDRDV